MLVSFVLSFFPRDVLDEILNLIGSVSEGFPSYSFTPYEIFTNTYNGRRILPAAVSRISSVTWQPSKREMARNLCYLFAPFQRKGWDMKSCYVSLRKNPAGSPENKK